METRKKRAVRVGVLLSGYSALLGGLFGLRADPIVAVLMVLGGMALAICSAAELVLGDSASGSPPQEF